MQTHNPMKIIIAASVCIALVLVGLSMYVHEVKQDTVQATKLALAEQETRLAAIAEVTDRDGADAVVEAIIQDCSPENRARFDTQLGRLPELKGAELREINQLFEACGDFFAERKAVMVARLEREFEVYGALISILKTVAPKEAELSYDVDLWKKLVSLEVERSSLSTTLVSIQGTIIKELMSGTSVSSDVLQTTLVDGQKAKEKLIAIAETIDGVRQQLLDI